MGDQDIIRLYWERNQDAITETETQYGNYCHTISFRIVRDREDAAECVNDTWLRAWNAMPPERPNRLSIWLGRITRNLSLNRLEANNAGKRGGGEVELSYEELENALAHNGRSHVFQIVTRPDSADEALEAKELASEISTYLLTIDKQKRIAFVGRYYYFAELDEIADLTGFSKKHLSVVLYRVRQDLIKHLRERGYDL